MDLQALKKKLSSWFFSFRIVNRRVSFLLFLLVVAMGGFSLMSIPKESSPKIEFWIIQISTFRPGVNPVDMDNLITEKIEKAIEDINGIKKISSTSSVWFSSTVVELQNNADTNDVLIEIKDEVEKVDLPDEAEDPVVTELSTDNEVMFELVIYGDETLFPKSRLLEAARTLQNKLEGTNGITTMNIVGDAAYDLQILVDKATIEELGISLSQVSSALRAYNQNIPLGQYEVDDLEYDFRIQGELSTEEEIRQIPIVTEGIATLTIGDVATVHRNYTDESVRKVGLLSKNWYNAITMTVNKREGVNIFSASSDAKKAIENELKTQWFNGIQHLYSSDLSEIIIEDYQTLATNGRQTLVLVFICCLIFIGLKESIIATIGIPLAFLTTFFVLDQLGLSLNFLTNFSLVLTLGIAIDTFIVIVEAAFERVKLGYNPKTAAMLAVRDFKAPLISWTATTIAVFIPMMSLPGVTGKFLAYIPITIFATLVAALFISLTVNPALYYRFSKKKTRYVAWMNAEQFLTAEDRALLEAERVWKEARDEAHSSRHQKFLERLNGRYERFLRWYLSSKRRRIFSIIIPVILLVLSLIFLSPQIGFTLFPDGDNERFDLIITTKVGTNTETTAKRIPYIEPTLSDIPELKLYTITANDNTINVAVELTDNKKRQREGLRDVFEVEKDVNEKLAFLQQEGLTVESAPLAGGPPQSKPVAIKLVADTSDKFSVLLEVANDFKEYLRTVEGTKNVSVSSKETPWQFVYTFNYATLSRLGLTPNDIIWELAPALNGQNAGSITINEQDIDIEVLYNEFSTTVSPSEILDLTITTRVGPVKVSDVLSYSVDNAVGEIARENTAILVRVESDLTEEYQNRWPELQAILLERAAQYTFPAGITYQAGGEGQENQDLIMATFRGFFIAIFLIFSILVLQFNSFRKPAIIMYSIVCAMLGVNIGLFLTGNPYSMPFAIWFIALTGIVVNDAIVLIDRIVENMSHDIDAFDAIVEAGRSRLQPIILTTLTTLLWVLPLSLQDKFREGLWFTLIFGLFAGSAMTLFVIPSLYYVFFAKAHGGSEDEE